MLSPDQLRRESNAFAAFTNAFAARFPRSEFSWRLLHWDGRIEFRLDGLPTFPVSAYFLADLPETAIDLAELHFRQAEAYRRWTRALA